MNSKMTSATKENRVTEQNAAQRLVENFMGGVSYKVNPLDTLKIVSASSIFGEPQYYRNGEFEEKGISDGRFYVDELFAEYCIFASGEFAGENTSVIFEKIIDASLDFDFKGTLEWAVSLRHDFNMRLNPQVIMVRAAIHSGRKAFTEENPGKFAEYEEKIMARGDEPASQLTYYLYRNGKKNNVPGLLKKAWSKKLGSLSAYEVNKYKNGGIGLIDTVRICHANSAIIDELMSTGKVTVTEEEQTWEVLRSAGKSWKEILETIKIGHMALLRNLHGIFTEIEDRATCEKWMETLKKGVPTGKQFPFRYKSAYDVISASSGIFNKVLILDTLEECIDIACDNMPRLPGKTMCLSDNSGSAWGAFTSEYGRVTIAQIDNLSSVIAAKNSEEGYTGVFGDRLIVTPTSHRDGVLSQTDSITKKGRTVGGSTENGIWLFFRDAIDKKEHWDNIFIFSDQQAGHGGLYGTDEGKSEYKRRGYATAKGYGSYVDVAKLIADYRRSVNPKVNVFTIQTAGYDNVLVPENGYRTSILYGWTGKELVYADQINKIWDEIDARKTEN